LGKLIASRFPSPSYVPPKCRLGDKLACEYRGREKLTPEARAMSKEAMKSPEVGAKIRAALAGRPLHSNTIAGRQQTIHSPPSFL